MNGGANDRAPGRLCGRSGTSGRLAVETMGKLVSVHRRSPNEVRPLMHRLVRNDFICHLIWALKKMCGYRKRARVRCRFVVRQLVGPVVQDAAADAGRQPPTTGNFYELRVQPTMPPLVTELLAQHRDYPRDRLAPLH